MLTLIPDKKLNAEDKNNVIKIPYTYLHGHLEKDNEWDVFYVKDDENIFDKGKNLSPGVYPCVSDDSYCMFYLWNTFQGFHGLACYTVDESANKFALECFHSKTTVI